ncbi:osteoclast-associated immunoglobulin-like receptor isoform X1 [Meriones unguiculatus]|uniref:osteoclast-associated immunoglobulin-like receptor isoform X1 n=1 Tax=Meriones unguiculatus TaxID=10047 RepID=UPI00293F0ABA|nr:osteoclast-associated immunoglobulin-like receptor isoform X1 [Meriones unguiculatus]
MILLLILQLLTLWPVCRTDLTLTGLCVGQTDISGNFESIFKPSLSVWPSSVLPTRSNVTLQCITVMQYAKCVIKKDGTNLDNRTVTGVTGGWISKSHLIMGWSGTTEFHLGDLQQSDAGCYTCECHEDENSDATSSDPLLLLITGHLPKPSLQAHEWSSVMAGGNVTLNCQKADNVTEYKTFMLLKEGVPSPVQIQSSEGNRADFSLHDVTPKDTGNYSCVYHQTGAPFWASHPSDHLEILVSDLLPKPSLSAWPSSVAPENSSVTLRCVSPRSGIQLVLRKGGVILDSRLPHHLTERTAEFRLNNLQQGDAGYYTCVYYIKESPSKISSSSDVLLLLVTGYSSKPSIQVHPSGQMTTGGKVNLQCERPHNLTEYKMFALLKEGRPSLLQLLSSENNKVEFTLQNVTVGDAGRYSCVYFQAEAPFRASHPSDRLAILVAISPSDISEYYTKTNIIRLGMSAIFVVFMVIFLAEAWNSQKPPPNRPRLRTAALE